MLAVSSCNITSIHEISSSITTTVHCGPPWALVPASRGRSRMVMGFGAAHHNPPSVGATVGIWRMPVSDHSRPQAVSDWSHSRVDQPNWPRLWRMRRGAFIPDAEHHSEIRGSRTGTGRGGRLCEGDSPWLWPVQSGQGRVKESVPGTAWPGQTWDCRRTCPGKPPPQSRRRP